MNIKNEFQTLECNDNDVLSFPGEVTFKIGKFRKAVDEAINEDLGRQFTDKLIEKGINIDPQKLRPEGKRETYKNWFKEGIDCEILKLGFKSWKKGKVTIKISIEFSAEEQEDNLEIIEAESPLDDIRRMINEVNS